jgi:hypothetical protein
MKRFIVTFRGGCSSVTGPSRLAVLAWLTRTYPERAPFKILVQPKGRKET